jgi:hypothetical protein
MEKFFNKLAFLPYFTAATFSVIYSTYIVKTDDSQTYLKLVSTSSDIGFEVYLSNFQPGFAYLIKISSIFPPIMVFITIISVYYVVRKTFEFLSNKYAIRMFALIFVFIPFFNITGYLGSAWRIQISLALFVLGLRFSANKLIFILLIACSLSVHSGNILILLIYTIYLMLGSSMKLSKKLFYFLLSIFSIVIILYLISILRGETLDFDLRSVYLEYYNLIVSRRLDHYSEFNEEVLFDFIPKLVVMTILSLKIVFIESKGLSSENNRIILLILLLTGLLFFVSPSIGTRLFNTVQYLIPLVLLKGFRISLGVSKKVFENG